MTPGRDALPQLLQALRALVPDEDGPMVNEFIRRIDQDALRVVVVGEAKRGKSTLVNALLGRDLLPSGVVPLTSVATTMVHDHHEYLQVRFADGRDVREDLTSLTGLVTERGNPGNRRGVIDVVVHVPAPLLDGGVELVDTPGVGSVYAHNSDEAANAYTRMDAAIFVLTADPPISQSERSLLRDVRDQAVRVFCVLNKMDRLSAAEVDEARAFTERVVASELGEEVPVWPVSARRALQRTGVSSDEGDSAARFDSFSDALYDYLAHHRDTDLTRSIATRAQRLARGLAETAAATLATLSVSQDQLRAKLDAFAVRRDAVERERSETVAIATAELQRLIQETNGQAQALRLENQPRVCQAVTDALARATGSMSDVEQAGLDRAAAEITDIVDTWRNRRAKELDAALAHLDHRIGERLHAHIAAVRDSAASLLGIDLDPATTTVALTGRTAFSYQFTADPGQVDALAAGVRHRLPAILARRSISNYVRKRADSLLDRHIGRARADFQRQLDETHRRLAAGIDQQFSEAAGRLAEAVTAAGRVRQRQAAETEKLRQQAADRKAKASRLARQLASATAATTAAASD